MANILYFNIGLINLLLVVSEISNDKMVAVDGVQDSRKLNDICQHLWALQLDFIFVRQYTFVKMDVPKYNLKKIGQNTHTHF